MAILMGDGACGSEHDAIDERRAEVSRGIYGRAFGDELFAPDNLGNINRHESVAFRVSGQTFIDWIAACA